MRRCKERRKDTTQAFSFQQIAHMAAFSEEEMAGLVKQYVEKWTEAEALKKIRTLPRHLDRFTRTLDLERATLERDGIMKKVITNGGKAEFQEFTEAVLPKLSAQIEDPDASDFAKMTVQAIKINASKLVLKTDVTKAVNIFLDSNKQTLSMKPSYRQTVLAKTQSFLMDICLDITAAQNEEEVANKEALSSLFQCTVNLPLMLAAELGKLDIVHHLVETKGANINFRDTAKASNVPIEPDFPAYVRPKHPVEAAAYGGHYECLKYLIEKGALANGRCLRLRRVVHPVAPLWWAVCKMHTKCTQLLLEAGADVNLIVTTDITFDCAASTTDKTPLLLAVCNGDIPSLKLLLGAGADVNQACNRNKAPLWEAAYRNNTSVTQLLLEAGADVNMSSEGKTLLQDAEKRGDAALVKLLLEAGADVNQNKGALWEAACEGHAAVVKLVLEFGADLNHPRYPCTPFVASVTLGIAGHVYHVDLDEDKHQGYIDCVNLMLEAGADVNLVSPGRSTTSRAPLWMAVNSNNPHMLKLLLDAGADVNFRCRGQSTPVDCLWNLMFTIGRNKNIEGGMKLLFDAGAKVNMCARSTSSIVMYVDNSKDREHQMNVARLVFAAGQKIVTGHHFPGDPTPSQTAFYPLGWLEIDLKNQCRKVIRKHLLTLDPHTNLFIRVPQLQGHTPKRLISYLLLDQHLDVDWGTVSFHQQEPLRNAIGFDRIPDYDHDDDYHYGSSDDESYDWF